VLQRKLKSERSPLSHGVTQRFSEISEALSEAIGAVKAISTELRPGVLDQLGLPAAIEWQCREFSRRSGIDCKFKIPGRKIILGAGVSTALFRVFQEALTNIARHAQATKVDVVFSVNKQGVSLTVSDNGRGIAQSELVAPDSLGLLGMRERMEAVGGEFSIAAGPAGKGTVVSAHVKARQNRRGKVK
jgi:signal transduction histidine kinase